MAPAAVTGPKAGRRSPVVDRDLVPDLSLGPFMPEIRHRPNTHGASNQPASYNVRELPYW